jgi:cation:H+ antiporter
MTLGMIGWFVAGLVLLVVGAESLVRGASRLAAAVGLSPLVIGLTVVAFGTSAPEMAVSVGGALSGQGDLAVGNVVGSNIFNVLFILGAAAAIAPLVVSMQLLRFDVPVMIGVSVATLLVAADGVVGRIEGVLLVVGLAVYTALLIRLSRRERAAIQDEFAAEYASAAQSAGQLVLQVALVAGGLGLLVLGAGWLVSAAVQMATAFGLSELVIGLTIVAAGTSLPEVATSLIATVRGERDIAVGNVVGSNIFNLLGVLGLSAAVAPDGLRVTPAALGFDVPVMIAVAVACLPIFFTGRLIARWEGWLFLAYYVAYTAYLIMAVAQHDALPLFSSAMVAFVMPLTAVTLLVLTVRAVRGAPPDVRP